MKDFFADGFIEKLADLFEGFSPQFGIFLQEGFLKLLYGNFNRAFYGKIPSLSFFIFSQIFFCRSSLWHGKDFIGIRQ